MAIMEPRHNISILSIDGHISDATDDARGRNSILVL